MADDDVMAGSEEAAEITEDEAQPVEEETEVEAVDTEGDDTEESEDGETEEVEEYEFNLLGNRHSVPVDMMPPEVAEALQQYAKKAEATITEKGQANSEQAKALDAMRSEVHAEREAVARVKQLDDEAFGLYAQGRSIQQDLARIDEDFDLNALWQQNPDEARRISDYRTSLAQQLTQIQQATAAKEVESDNATQAEVSRRMEAGKAKVSEAIPDFDEKAIVDYAMSKGIDEQSAKNWALNPIVTMMAHNSMRYEEMLSKAKATKKRAPEPAKPVKPVARASQGKRTSAEPSDKDSAEEWVKKRNRQLAKRSAA